MTEHICMCQWAVPPDGDTGRWHGPLQLSCATRQRCESGIDYKLRWGDLECFVPREIGARRHALVEIIVGRSNIVENNSPFSFGFASHNDINKFNGKLWAATLVIFAYYSP